MAKVCAQSHWRAIKLQVFYPLFMEICVFNESCKFYMAARHFDQPRKQRLRNPEVIGSDPVVGHF